MQPIDIDFYTRLAKGVAKQFGPRCEVVVHDLQSKNPDSTIVAIENGQVSGRKLGDGPSHVTLEALRGDTKKVEDRYAYLTKTEDGKILKSSMTFIRDDEGKPTGIFIINFDITLMLAMEGALREINSTDTNATSEPESIPRDVASLLNELIEQSVKLVGKPVALMSRDDKVKAIGFLNDAGAFLVTKSGQKVCKYFGMSKYTLYSYIDEAGKSKS